MDVDSINDMLDKAINKQKKPMWRKNLETIAYIIVFFVGLPLITWYLYNNGNYIFGTLLSLIIIGSIILGFYGNKIKSNMLNKYYGLK